MHGKVNEAARAEPEQQQRMKNLHNERHLKGKRSPASVPYQPITMHNASWSCFWLSGTIRGSCIIPCTKPPPPGLKLISPLQQGIVMPNNIGHGSGQRLQSRRGINHFSSGPESTLDFMRDHVAGVLLNARDRDLIQFARSECVWRSKNKQALHFLTTRQKRADFGKHYDMRVISGSVSRYIA